MKRKLFGSILVQLQVWQTDFEHLLRIRFFSHHSRCSQCVKHRLIIKKLGHCPPARRAQHEMLQRHLRRQLRDRQLYWGARAVSRLSATTLGSCQITMILDSMGAQRHSWPRSQCMAAKEFSSFNRPRLANTTLIIHGFAVVTALSSHLVPTNASRSIEILAGGLTMLHQRGIDLTTIFLNVQADNCCKEVKNNGTIRFLAMKTALHCLGGAEVNFLTSGHSHEDIDALFSVIGSEVESCKELWTPQDFQQCLEKFMQNTQVRPYEPQRRVVLLNQFKDWTLQFLFHQRFWVLCCWCEA